MQNNSRVICLGSIACDIIPGKPTPDGEVSLTAYPGGSVFNTAIQMARLGLGVSLLSKTGTDFLSDVLMRHAKKEKVDTSYVVRNNGIRTALALANIDKKGDSSYIFYRTSGKEAAFSNKEMPEDILENAAVLHTASGFSYADLTFENTLSLMERASKRKVFISYDPNWRAKRVKDVRKERRRIRKLISHVDLLKLSESDATGITGTKTLNSALAKLPQNIFVTLGDKGSFFWTGGKLIACPAFKVKVVDTIGAGDGFTAGLVHRYITSGKKPFSEKNENEIKTDLAFASVVSGLICTDRGATSGLRDVHQVENFLKQHRLA